MNTKRHFAVLALGLAMGCNSGSGGDGGGSGGSADEGGKGGGSDEGGGGGSGGSTKSGGSGGSTASGGAKSGGSGGSVGSGGAKSGGSGGSGGTAMTGGAAGAAPDPNLPAAPGCTEFKAMARDFTAKHSDFQIPYNPLAMSETLAGTGLVQAELGADKKPVLVAPSAGHLIASANSFKEWWNDTAGVNMSATITLTHSKRSAVLYQFGGETPEGDFFPIDGKLLGNIDFPADGKAVSPDDKAVDDVHNFLFTTEIHAEFVYQGGKNEIIISESDDDSWVFINGKLVIDNGGLHGFSPASATLDGMAAALGLEKGKRYPISFFFADRHAGGARYRVSSNLIFTKCGP